MAEFGSTINEEMDIWMRKIRKSILPPDPARVIEFVLRGPATIEHISPLPPLIERIHAEFTAPAVEKLPRLPLTAEPPVFEWLRWVKE